MTPIEDTRDHLDAAIDAVAKQLTRVEDDPHLASRIVASLPDRSRSLFGWWAPRLAMVAVVMAAALVWATRGSNENVPTRVLASVPIEVPPNVPIEVVPEVPQNGRANDRPDPPQNDRWNDRWNDRDFDHSLPSIADVASLELDAIAPSSLPEDAPLTLVPLAIPDLPAADPISPQ
jgi:hypothetical protein